MTPLRLFKEEAISIKKMVLDWFGFWKVKIPLGRCLKAWHTFISLLALEREQHQSSDIHSYLTENLERYN